MTKVLLEYVWLDGYRTPNLRSKVKVINHDEKREPQVSDCPIWNFDGSSTQQAPGNESECLLEPVRLYKWAENHYLVMTEVMNSDHTPHKTNRRADLRQQQATFDKAGFWWGFEQEYFITKDFIPLGFPEGGYPKPQGLYYCGVGSNQVRGRQLA